MSDHDDEDDGPAETEQERRFRDILGQLDRYGIPDEDALDVLDALTDFIDDRCHGRADLENTRQRLREAVEKLEIR